MSIELTEASLRTFEKNYDTSREDRALESRDEFLRRFPLSSLGSLTLDHYIVGKQQNTFCAHVEAKTREWAAIQGATAFKFGVYFGITKSDPTRRWIFPRFC